MNNGGQNYPSGQNMYSPGQFPNAPMQTPNNIYQTPPVKKFSLTSIIVIIIVSLVAIGALVLTAWMYVKYNDTRTDVQGQIGTAVNDAKKAQADDDAAKFSEKEKEPNRTFVGPEDYGRLTFDYPKTWSVYTATDVTSNGGNYAAYLNPVAVPPVTNGQLFALEVKIEQKDVDSVLQSYDSSVKSGKLKTKPVTVGTSQGTRLSGDLSTGIRGAAVIFKIRDKTVTIQTDANTFLPDFDKIISTIKFNQ